MRKPLIVGIGFTCLMAVPALGALAAFEGLNPGSSGNEVWVSAGTDAQFSITLSVELISGFKGADVVIGSNDVTDVSFAYSPEWLAAMANVTPIASDATGTYLQEVFVGGNNPTASVGTSLLLGTLTVSTTGLADGDYIVAVDGDMDGLSILALSPSEIETITGFGTIHVPEPSCFGLVLAAGFVACLRRR